MSLRALMSACSSGGIFGGSGILTPLCLGGGGMCPKFELGGGGNPSRVSGDGRRVWTLGGGGLEVALSLSLTPLAVGDGGGL